MTNDGETSAPIVQLAQSDWTDQDLLTKQEARERLVVEIARARSRLEELASCTTGSAEAEAEVLLLVRRLRAMESVRDEYQGHHSGAIETLDNGLPRVGAQSWDHPERR